VTRHHPFVRALVFALAAAAAWLLLTPLFAPLAGARGAARALLLASVALHLAWIAPTRARALAASGTAAVAGLVLLALPQGLAATALCGAALLGACRSGILYRQRPARAVVIEAALLGSGLVLARFLAGYDPASLALGAWGFWLCQSAFFLVGGVEARPDDPAQGDPFEHARSRILTLLE
jgi:hypothetical protein